ncbi:HAD family hydrolase [Calidifontibacter terrae]
MTDVRAVSLDIWGTLLRSDPAFKPERNELLRSALVPQVDSERFDAVMREADREADEISMGRGADVGFVERIELTLARLEAKVVQPPYEELFRQQQQLALEHHPLPLDERLPGLVASLAGTMPVVLTSNTGMLPGSLMRHLLQLAGFPPIAGIFSNEVDWAKPDRRIFAATLELIARIEGEPIGPGDVLHIGDNPVADADGARSAGLQTVLVRPNGEDTAAALEALR